MFLQSHLENSNISVVIKDKELWINECCCTKENKRHLMRFMLIKFLRKWVVISEIWACWLMRVNEHVSGCFDPVLCVGVSCRVSALQQYKLHWVNWFLASIHFSSTPYICAIEVFVQQKTVNIFLVSQGGFDSVLHIFRLPPWVLGFFFSCEKIFLGFFFFFVTDAVVGRLL